MIGADVVLHSCPLSPHGRKLGATPQPESAACPDLFAGVPELLVIMFVMLSVAIAIGRIRRTEDSE